MSVWQCHRCGQKNYSKYYYCMRCETKKYICPKCGKVDYDYHDGRKATLLDRLKFILFGMKSSEQGYK